jgi:hypothetical protein
MTLNDPKPIKKKTKSIEFKIFLELRFVISGDENAKEHLGKILLTK